MPFILCFKHELWRQENRPHVIFIDCAKWLEENNKILEELEKLCWNVGVMCQDGNMFHGPTHLRFNLALPKSLVEEAMNRLDKYVFNA